MDVLGSPIKGRPRLTLNICEKEASLTTEQLLPLRLTLTRYIADKLITTTVKEEVLKNCIKIAED